MITKPSFIIVGGGLAGALAAQTLREEGFDGSITLLGQEPNARTNARPYPRTTYRGKPTATASSSTQSRGTPSTAWTCLWVRL
jgi:cation diffusion facilitator CzcD-associated flavoprotein CzcO